MATDISEAGLEKIISDYLVDVNGYELGKAAEFSKEYALDEGQVLRFLQATQPEKVKAAHILDSEYERNKFFVSLRKKLGEAGIIDILRNGFRYLAYKFDLYYFTPSEQNPMAKALYARNIFSVTRQVTYSKEFPRLALDLAIFINGLPIATFELKNRLTKQNVDDAVNQYMNDRDPKELIFNFKRCAVHFAVDDNEVKMCTRLCGKASWFLPFNRQSAQSGWHQDRLSLERDSDQGIVVEYFGELFAGGRENRSKDEQGCRRNHDFPTLSSIDGGSQTVGRYPSE